MTRLATMEKWEGVLVRFAESDLDAREFCKVEGITYASLFGWKSKLLPNLRDRINDFWRQHLKRQLDSGLSQAAYCREYDLSREAFKSFAQEEQKRIEQGKPLPTKKPYASDLPRPPRFSDAEMEKLIYKFLPSSNPKKETIELWYKRLTQFYESGLSVEDFAKQLGVASGYLRQWIRNLENYFVDGKPQPIGFDNVQFGTVVSYSQKRQHWRKVMEEFALSGQTVNEFCKQRGIETFNFHQWKKSLRKFDKKHGIEKKVVGSQELGVRRSSIVKWIEILRRFEQSGLTIAAFVRQNEEGVSEGSLISWKKKLAPYFVKNEHERYHEIDLLKPKLPKKDSREKLKKLWKLRLRSVRSILSTDKAPLSYYFWAVELGLDLDEQTIPVLYDPASTMEQIEEAEKNGTLRTATESDNEAEKLDTHDSDTDGLNVADQTLESAVSEDVQEFEPSDKGEIASGKLGATSMAESNELKSTDPGLARNEATSGQVILPETAAANGPAVSPSESGVCVSITMPDGSQIDLPKNMFAIEALVQRLVNQ